MPSRIVLTPEQACAVVQWVDADKLDEDPEVLLIRARQSLAGRMTDFTTMVDVVRSIRGRLHWSDSDAVIGDIPPVMPDSYLYPGHARVRQEWDAGGLGRSTKVLLNRRYIGYMVVMGLSGAAVPPDVEYAIRLVADDEFDNAQRDEMRETFAIYLAALVSREMLQKVDPQ